MSERTVQQAAAPAEGSLGAAGPESAGLPNAPEAADAALRDAGIDPDWLSISFLGVQDRQIRAVPLPWAICLGVAFTLWCLMVALRQSSYDVPKWLEATATLTIGLLVLQAACSALITASS